MPKYQDRIVDENDAHNHPDSNKMPPQQWDYSIHAKDQIDVEQPKSTDGRQMLEDRKNR